jgi:hypothetical protein
MAKFNLANVPAYQLFRAVSGRLLKSPEYPNKKLNIGIDGENMGSVPQINFFNAIAKQNQEPVTNDKFDEGYLETRRGARTEPSQKDYWLGSPL